MDDNCNLSDLILAFMVVMFILGAAWLGYVYGYKHGPTKLLPESYVGCFSDGYQARVDHEQDMGAGLAP